MDKWIIAVNHRPRMNDGVELLKEKGHFSIYRYIDDWDEEGDTIYSVEEYLNGIPEQEFKAATGVASDRALRQWITAHLIKERSNSLDAIVVFLDAHDISYSHKYNGLTI